MQAALILTALVLLLAPNLAAVPDEPMWSQVLEGLVLLAIVISFLMSGKSPYAGRGDKNLRRLILIFIGLILASVNAKIASQHGSIAYLDVMLRGVAYFSTCAALFELGRRGAAAGPMQRLVLICSMIAGASVVSGIGIQEYLTHLRAGEATWRVFSLSTPDFLAGFLVIIVPLTLALLLAGPRSIATYGAFGLCLALEIGTILTTASRFALVSMAVSLIVFAVLSVYSRSKEAGEKEKPKYGIFIGAAVGFIVLCLGVGPIRKRLLHPDQNSAAFRLWTWKGTGHMIAAHPVFGSGIATYVFTYPAYALTGFTRLAHNAYLQIAAEAGVPALIILAAFFVLVLVVGVRNLVTLSGTTISGSEPWNQRIICCGVIAAAVAGLVQNFIDSDFYVFSCGTALFTVLGMCAGFRPAVDEPEAEEAPVPKKRSALSKPVLAKERWTAARIAIVAAAIVLCLFASLNALGAWNAKGAESALPNQDPGSEATSYYQNAMQLCPLNGQYPSDFGYKVTFRIGNNPAGAENDLRNAVSLRPEEVSYRRLSEILAAERKPAEALKALDLGIQQSPNDLDLLMRRAQMSPPAEAVVYYQRIADLEMTPVGTVRALDAIEVNFAIADANLADAKLGQGNAAEAITYYKRSVSTLQAYFKRNGGHDAQQMILRGAFDENREKMLQATLDHCTSQLQALQANTTAPGQIKVQ